MSNLAVGLIYANISQIKVNYVQYDSWGFDSGKYTETKGMVFRIREPISQ
jgi:hypothetical protein